MTGMSWKIKWWSILIFFVGFSACQTSYNEPYSGSLIEVEELKGRLDGGEKFTLLDIRPADDFKKGHLPGAVNIWRTEVEIDTLPFRGMAVDSESFANLLGEKGVKSDGWIVVYDDRGGVEAARIWWLLKRHGHEKCTILNGGLQAWGSPVTDEVVDAVPVEFVFSGPSHPEVMIDYSTFENWRRRPGMVVIDNRSAVEFSGEEMKNGAFMAGHIPGAINFCYSNAINFEPEGKMKLKALTQLETLYRPLAQKEDTVLLYCHSGVRSAHTYFVLTELLGYEHVYNYDGSWIEWSFRNQPSVADTLTNEQQLQL